MTNEEIVNKLIGPISPMANSEMDEERLKNLQEYCELIGEMVANVHGVAIYSDSPFGSANQIGQHAKKFLKHLKNELE